MFRPLSVYGQAPPQLAVSAAESAPDAVRSAGNEARLPGDLSDANLGLLEVPDQQEQPVQQRSEATGITQHFADRPGQHRPQPEGSAARSAGHPGQGGPEVPELVPVGGYKLVQGSLNQQPQQRLYSGPGTVAPPPSALPHPGSLTHPQAPLSYSTIVTGQPQTTASSAHFQAGLLAAQEPAAASLARPSVGPEGLPSGQWAAAGARQQPGVSVQDLASYHTATPDNNAGLYTWQAVANSQEGSTSLAAASAGLAPAAGLSGLPESRAGSFMRTGESAGRAGGFLGRDLFAEQRSELSRRASPASMWEAAHQTPGANALHAQLQPSGSVLDSHALDGACACALLSGMHVSPGTALKYLHS